MSGLSKIMIWVTLTILLTLIVSGVAWWSWTKITGQVRWTEQENGQTKEGEGIASGKSLFQQHCSSCHISPGKNIRDENQFGRIFERLPAPNESYFIKYIRDSKKLKDNGDEYARLLDKQFSSDYEHFFNELTEKEIQEIMVFIQRSSH